ncbi:hypothetical protein GOBAR_AA30335 [Gossypium barbadense]|uniref:Uncharacterized protein n=1 Tax=Gossypium barbadense TaxID=3634 RepID=A0A2P5WGX6_GOSBA|nr:hypothetical protein GOBAR_AA30335 [Gossypium barbadense]
MWQEENNGANHCKILCGMLFGPLRLSPALATFCALISPRICVTGGGCRFEVEIGRDFTFCWSADFWIELHSKAFGIQGTACAFRLPPSRLFIQRCAKGAPAHNTARGVPGMRWWQG